MQVSAYASLNLASRGAACGETTRGSFAASPTHKHLTLPTASIPVSIQPPLVRSDG